MAIKVMSFMRRKPGLSQQEFRDYYEKNHAPLALKYFGPYINRYVRNYPKIEDSAHGTDWFQHGKALDDRFNYDVVTELWYKDQAAYDTLHRLLAEDPKIGEIFGTDEARFIDRASVQYIVFDEDVSNHQPPV